VYDGRPLPGVEVATGAGAAGASATGPSAAGAEGRIRLRGPMLATGQLDPSAADAERFTADGWFVTDDLGRITADGTLEVLGRADAVINTGGVKVDPVAVEAALRALPDVADAVVIGVPDAEWGERVCALVLPAASSSPLTLAALRSAVSAVLPASHAPRELRVVEHISRDAMGKLSAAERARLSAAG